MEGTVARLAGTQHVCTIHVLTQVAQQWQCTKEQHDLFPISHPVADCPTKTVSCIYTLPKPAKLSLHSHVTQSVSDYSGHAAWKTCKDGQDKHPTRYDSKSTLHGQHSVRPAPEPQCP